MAQNFYISKVKHIDQGDETMVVILVILTVAVILTVEFIRRSWKPATAMAHVPVPRMHPSTNTIERYFHPGHCWVRVENPELAFVGVDDFTQHLIGSLDAVELPAEGTTVYQGQPFISLHHGKKTITQVAPMSGIVQRINHRLHAHPALVNRSPYEKGWMAQLIPTNFKTEVNNLLKGAVADRWLEAVRMQLLSWFAPKLGTVLQDGGEFIENISELLNEEEWNRLIRELYPNVYYRKHILSNL
jgi:glycine cleavage system H protein